MTSAVRAQHMVWHILCALSWRRMLQSPHFVRFAPSLMLAACDSQSGLRHAKHIGSLVEPKLLVWFADGDVPATAAVSKKHKAQPAPPVGPGTPRKGAIAASESPATAAESATSGAAAKRGVSAQPGTAAPVKVQRRGAGELPAIRPTKKLHMLGSGAARSAADSGAARAAANLQRANVISNLADGTSAPKRKGMSSAAAEDSGPAAAAEFQSGNCTGVLAPGEAA